MCPLSSLVLSSLRSEFGLAGRGPGQSGLAQPQGRSRRTAPEPDFEQIHADANAAHGQDDRGRTLFSIDEALQLVGCPRRNTNRGAGDAARTLGGIPGCGAIALPVVLSGRCDELVCTLIGHSKHFSDVP